VVASIENNQTEIPVARSARGKINVSSMDVDTRNNRFVADVVIPRDQGRNQTVKVSGRYVAMMKVPTVNRQMLNGDIITSADINYVSMRADTINSQYLTTVEKIIGMTPKKSIAPDSAIRISDLQVPLLVKRNDNVNVTLSSGSMKISMKGRALENGSMGSTIKVINTASKREIEATVVGFQEVVVESMTPAHQSIAQGVNNVSTN
jgi:flagella basal body P-ring formation protein FlgA